MSQTWSADRYARTARFVSDLGAPVVELLGPRPGERILDLGCGDGALTVKLLEAGAEVVGIDSSSDMIEAARKAGVDARVMDAHALPFDHEFDAVFSNAALHWMTRADEVIAGVARALKPNGRFVGEMGGHGCVAAITIALVAALDRRGIDGFARRPWYFPTEQDYGARLQANGFTVEEIKLFPRPTPLPGEMTEWLGTFASPFLVGFDADERDAIVDEASEMLRPVLWSRETAWTADYVRLRFRARLRE